MLTWAEKKQEFRKERELWIEPVVLAGRQEQALEGY